MVSPSQTRNLTQEKVQFTPAPAKVLGKVDCTTTAHWFESDSPTSAASADMGSVPAGFAPIYAVKCQPNRNDSTDPLTAVKTITEQKLSGNMEPLVAALSMPSDKASAGQPCEAMLQIIPDLWLVDATGRAIHVTWPQTACNFAKPETEQALAELRIENESTLNVSASTGSSQSK